MSFPISCLIPFKFPLFIHRLALSHFLPSSPLRQSKSVTLHFLPYNQLLSSCPSPCCPALFLVSFISPPNRHSSRFSFLYLILVEIIISSLVFFSFFPFVRKIPFSVSPTSFSSPSYHHSSPPSFLPLFLFHAL